MPIYMQIPDIEGSVSARGHENWIELETFDYALARHITAEAGRIADRESTSPSFGEISVRKKIDKSTPYLFSASSAGKSQGTVLVHACYTSDDLTPYLEFELRDVIVSNYRMSGIDKSPSKIFYEALQLNYSGLEVKYTPRDSANNPMSPVAAGYNLATAELM
jgi:type VI secretion system secreted protein Hcp